MKILIWLCIVLVTVLPGIASAGDVTVTLVGVNPLTINIKGDTQNEEAGNISIYLYFRDDDTTDLDEDNVDASQLEDTWEWGTAFHTKAIQTGTWSVGGHDFTRRLYYDNAGISSLDDYWTTSGVNVIVCTFTSVGNGHAYVEVNGVDGLANWEGTGHNVTYGNQDASLPVELSSFTAIDSAAGVQLEWTTQTEVNNIGFYIYRSETEEGEYTRVNKEIIEGAGNSAMPQTYKYIDDSLDPNIDTYFYYLEDLDIHGIKDKSQIIKVTRRKVSKFTAEYHKNSVNLKWSVEPQFYIPAWNVYRSTGENGAYVKLDKPQIKYDNQTYTYSYTELFPDEYFYQHSSEHLYYYLEGMDSEKRPLIKSRAIKVEIIPESFALLQNYPNPYNPETWIPYQLPEDTEVTIKIYSITGHLVKTLSLGEKMAGMYISRDRAAYWDGKNEADEKVSSGLYFYAIEAENFRAVRKMLLVK